MRFTMPTFNTLNTLALMVCVILSGCSHTDQADKAHPEVSIETVPVLVATGCIAPDGRPEDVRNLNQRYTADEWAALPTGSKAQAVRAQSGVRMNYEDALEAATAGCE